MRTKTCPACPPKKGPQPVTAFGKNRSAKDGLHYYCKACAAEKQRAWAASHPEKISEMRTNYLTRVYAKNSTGDPYE